MIATTEEILVSVFNQAAGKENAVERVKKLKDYAFVHFRERSDALRAMETLNSNCFMLIYFLYFGMNLITKSPCNLWGAAIRGYELKSIHPERTYINLYGTYT